MPKTERTYAEELERAAYWLDDIAKTMRNSYMVNGKWTDPRGHDKDDHDEVVGLAKALRRAAKYAKANPLGGPARLFEAVATRIRAGEKMKDVMADMGLQFDKIHSGGKRSDKGREKHNRRRS